MTLKRSAGILLHPTSLPSRFPIGDLGPSAYSFIDFLGNSGVGLWQVLPLGPTGYGESPYASLSSFAGNPYLISLELLEQEGLVSTNEIKSPPHCQTGRVSYMAVRNWKMPLIEKAAGVFSEKMHKKGSKAGEEFQQFCNDNSGWLEDYALFSVVKNHFDRKAMEEGVDDSRWNIYWDKDIALKEKSAVEKWRNNKKSEIETVKIEQFFFYRQWGRLRRYANEKNIQIIGDIPIFVSPESADLWAHRELFHVDKEGKPTVVSGVPPDYFSVNGQLWGNPLYKWDAHLADGFSWWISRIQALLGMVDIIRIDHFRGFEACWEIPAGAKNAVHGNWVKAPGAKLFRAIKEKCGDIPILAEDLGVITAEVNALRDDFGFPGMKVLQFAFEYNEKGKLNTENVFLPFNYTENSVVYTGTHDNDTTRGWYYSISDGERDLVRRYLARPDDDIVWDLIREAMRSVSLYAIFPMQDLLALDNSARMNLPATVGNANWSWKMAEEGMNKFVSSRFREMVELYGRM